MDVSLNVLTLNCWGIRIPVFGSQLIDQRISAIADLVNKNDYDVVVFQEVWSSHDHVALSCKLLDKLPFTHYYHGGWLGSGICIFSRYPILETVYLDFPLNGHAHKILHGDWYGAKGCSLAILKVNDLTVNVYGTHMHARYNHNNEFDEYAGHRALQAMSLSQFVKHTSGGCDAVIVVGDFNSTPNEVAYRLVRSNAVLNDAWLTKNTEESGVRGYTSDTPGNCFTPPAVLSLLPDGQRIDYIFYRANDQTDIRLESSKVIKDKVPGTQIDYSDHYAVEARMFIKRNITAAQVPLPDLGVRRRCLEELSAEINKGSARARSNKYYYFVTMILCLMVLLLCRERYTGDAGNFLHAILEILQATMAVMSGLSFWIWSVMCRREENEYRAVKCDIENMLKALSAVRLKRE